MELNLLQGDCLELFSQIPDNSVDLIVTDPPYQIDNTKAGGKSALAKSIQSMNNELADAIIRILDLAGGKKVSLFSLYDSIIVQDSLNHISIRNSFTENIYTVVRFVTCEMDLSFRLTIALRMIESIAVLYDIDLAWHIEYKMIYNASRSYKHGKMY